VYSPSQIQQGVNSAVGMADQRTQGQNAALARQGAVRGIGTRTSPLMQALMGQNTAMGNAAAMDAATGFRQNAAQQNAGHLLDSQKAAYQGWNQTQALGLQGQKNQMDYSAALLNALAGLGNINIGV
jgi:hypothetical protein